MRGASRLPGWFGVGDKQGLVTTAPGAFYSEPEYLAHCDTAFDLLCWHWCCSAIHSCIDVPCCCLCTAVGQFQNLVRVADADAQLRKVLQIILKLSKEKWDEAAAHAMQAVVPDFRRRVWYPPGYSMGIGLVFNCKYGSVQLRDTISLAQAQPDGSVKVWCGFGHGYIAVDSSPY